MDDVKRGLEGHHALAKGNNVGVVVLTAKAGGFEVPAEGAADSPDAIGDDGFAVAGTAENDAALAFAAGNGFSDGTDEQRIVHGGLGESSEIADFMSEFFKELADGFLVLKASVV